MNIKKIRHIQAFTLIEILIAIAIAAAVMGMVIYTIMASMELRKKAIYLNTAIFLAEKKMNEIKSKDDLPDEQGEFPENKGYSFAYSMKEVDYDPFSGLISSEKSSSDIQQQYRESKTSSLSTGLSFKMKQYNVNIYYNEKKIYSLESLRGLKIDQTQK